MSDDTEKLNNEEQKRVFLVDGNSYLYRAFFATPYLSNSKGVPTNATYAFISMLKRLINNDPKPDMVIVVFDSKGPSFREEISAQYKAHRPPMPDNMVVQIPYVKSVIAAMGIPAMEQEGFEADDIIGTIVEEMKGTASQLYIITSDKDMTQLLCDNVRIFDTAKNIVIGEAQAQEKFGVSPSLMTDYLALCGDASDNIPGVSGIGPKTARELIENYGPIEQIYENIDSIKKTSLKEKLSVSKELAFMSKQLATIKRDVPLNVGIDTLRMEKQDTRTLKSIYRELEFSSLYRELEGQRSDDGNDSAVQPEEISIDRLGVERVGIVCVFQGKSPGHFRLDSFAAYDGSGVVFSRSGDDLMSIFQNAKEIVVHDLKPVFLYMEENAPPGSPGMTEGNAQYFDTMLAAYLINPQRKDYLLEGILEEYLGRIPGTGDRRQFLIDAVVCLFDLRETFLERLKDTGVIGLFTDIELPLVRVLADMEYYGVRVDRKMLSLLSRDFDTRLNGIAKEVYGLAGEPFNINSPQQLSRILFDTLQLTPVKKTKKGFSTDTEVLLALSAFHPLPEKIIQYRTLAKLKSTYVDVLPGLINPTTGRIHTTFNQMVVATGRLSSSDPNLQNIPVRGEEGRRIREAFIAADGYVLLSSDYSQIELRILAHLSGDALLTDAFLRDEDIHAKVAAEVFGVTPGQVTPDMRRVAKVINFGIVYGMSGYGLAKELGVSQKEAQQYIEGYFEKYQGVKLYITGIIEQAKKTGFVTTLFGRIRYIPEINNPDATVRQLGERTAMNTPVQGTAADIIKVAMVNIHRRIVKDGLASRLILQIHDELLFETREDELHRMESIVKEEMESVVSLAVPLKVSLGYGKNWTLAHG